MANSEGADQPAHVLTLISAFVVRRLHRLVTKAMVRLSDPVSWYYITRSRTPKPVFPPDEICVLDTCSITLHGLKHSEYVTINNYKPLFCHLKVLTNTLIGETDTCQLITLI